MGAKVGTPVTPADVDADVRNRVAQERDLQGTILTYVAWRDPCGPYIDNTIRGNPRVRVQWRPVHVSTPLAKRDPCRRPPCLRHPNPAIFSGPIPSAIVISGPTPRLVAIPIPAGLSPLPVAVAVWASITFRSRRNPAPSMGFHHHPAAVRAQWLVKVALRANDDGWSHRRLRDNDRDLNRWWRRWWHCWLESW
jgi:hypothetical protein